MTVSFNEAVPIQAQDPLPDIPPTTFLAVHGNAEEFLQDGKAVMNNEIMDYDPSHDEEVMVISETCDDKAMVLNDTKIIIINNI